MFELGLRNPLVVVNIVNCHCKVRPKLYKNRDKITLSKVDNLKVTVQFERCFLLMAHISVISSRNPLNLYITEKLIKFSKSLLNFYLVISTK